MIDVFNQLFFNDLANMTEQERADMCGAASMQFAELGYVFAADALVTPLTMDIYQRTLNAGKLKIRIYTMNYAEMAEPLVEAGIRTGFGSDRLRVGPIKLFADGGMSNRTAAVKTPYLTPPHGRGLKIYSPEVLADTVRQYHENGYQVAVHAQGDDGIGDVLDAFEAVLGLRSDNPLRHRIEHGGCLYPELLARAARINVPVSVQPIFMSELGDGFLEAFGQERAKHLYPFKSMLEAGIHAGGSSDCPVSALDPRLGLRDAVLRQTPSGETLGPDEALTMDQALRLYTTEAAYLSFDEKYCGTIEPGKRADFTILGADPREIPPQEVPDIPVVMTIVGGEIVYLNM
jgi:predicted amidohydrolase YtcJ